MHAQPHQGDVLGVGAQLTASVARKMQAFLQGRPGVLHLDEIINKKDPMQVRRLMDELMKHQIPIQVAFLQGAIPLQTTAIFPRLLEFLLTCPVWSVNLGELRFSEVQCKELADTLRRAEAAESEAAAVAAKLGLKPDRCRIVRRKPGQQRPHQQAVGGFGVAEERPAEVAAEVEEPRVVAREGLLGVPGRRAEALEAPVSREPTARAAVVRSILEERIN